MTVRAGGDAVHPGGVASEGEDFLCGRRVPELDRVVATRCGDARSVGVEGGLLDVAGVTAEDEALGAGLCVPDVGLAGMGPCAPVGEDKPTTVGAERQPPKDVDVPPQGGQLAAVRGVPELELASGPVAIIVP